MIGQNSHELFSNLANWAFARKNGKLLIMANSIHEIEFYKRASFCIAKGQFFSSNRVIFVAEVISNATAMDPNLFHLQAQRF